LVGVRARVHARGLRVDAAVAVHHGGVPARGAVRGATRCGATADGPRARDGLSAADEASIVRELVREVARRQGWRATFAPILDPEGSGNGLHIHLSFR